MKVCHTYKYKQKLIPGFNEVSLDVFNELPPGVNENTIVVLCGRDEGILPSNFIGIVDNGQIPVTKHRCMKVLKNIVGVPSLESFNAAADGSTEYIKAIYNPVSLTDLHNLFLMGKNTSKHIIIGIGELGRITSVRSDLLNNEFVYGYVDEPSDEWEYPSNELEKMDGCSVIGVIGHKIFDDALARMYNASAKAQGMNCVCLMFDTESLDNFTDVVREYEIQGLNVVSPFKSAMFDHIDNLTGVTEDADAIDTVLNNNGTLIGFNTDVSAIEYAMRGKYPSSVLIIGTGGLARSAVLCMKKHGVKTYIIGSDRESTLSISKSTGAKPVKKVKLKAYDMIFNASEIGLDETQEYPFDLSDLKSDITVLDAVYSKETELLRAAKGRGCTIIDGKEILIGQAIESYRIWFGKEPDVGAMRSVL